MNLKHRNLLQRVDRLTNQERSYHSTKLKITDLKHQRILEITLYNNTPTTTMISRFGNIFSILSLMTIGKIRWVFTLLPLLMKKR